MNAEQITVAAKAEYKRVSRSMIAKHPGWSFLDCARSAKVSRDLLAKRLCREHGISTKDINFL